MKSYDKSYIVVACTCCFAACLIDVTSMLWLGTQYPGYNPLKETMSALGASESPVSNPMSVTWVIVGTLFIVFATGFYRSYQSTGTAGKIAAWLIGIYATGEDLGSGLFKRDFTGSSFSPSGIAHNILSGLGVAAMLFLPLVMIRIYGRKQYPKFYFFSLVIFVFSILSTALFSSNSFISADNVFVVFRGFWQWLLLGSFYVYLLTIATMMLKKEYRAANANFVATS